MKLLSVFLFSNIINGVLCKVIYQVEASNKNRKVIPIVLSKFITCVHQCTLFFEYIFSVGIKINKTQAIIINNLINSQYIFPYQNEFLYQYQFCGLRNHFILFAFKAI